MKSFLFILVLVFSNQAYGCIKVFENCVEGPSTKVIDNKNVFRQCWKYEIKYECLNDTYKDYCQVIKQTPGCEQVLSECAKTKNKNCIEYRDTYMCGNLINNKLQEIKLLDKEYTVIKDELDNKECINHEINSNCQEIDNVCLEGAETRNIDGKEIYKDCWRYEKKYACYGNSLISDCKEYEDKCALIKQTCLSKSENGICRHNEKQFECLKSSSIIVPDKSASCSTLGYCIDGDCEKISYTQNNNLNKAISSLSILSNLKKDFIEESCKEGAANCRVFKGEKQTCRLNPLGTRNCCRNKGWANDMKLSECNESEKLLSKQKESKLCHYVDSYCSSKLLGICMERKRSYCCFNSKMARIIHENGRKQLKIDWGTAKNPNCTSISIEQLQKLDFSKLDFSELYTDTFSKMNLNNHELITEKTKDVLLDKKEEITRRFKDHYEK